MSNPRAPLYRRHRFPPEVISTAVWLYFRFPLSLRMVEEMLAARGICVSYETVRRGRTSSAAHFPIRSAAGLLRVAINGIWTRVCRERTNSDGGAELHRRWGQAPRSRPSGAGFKPPQAATVKSRGGERCGKGGA